MEGSWQLGDDSAGHRGEAGGRKTGESRHQWWSWGEEDGEMESGRWGAYPNNGSLEKTRTMRWLGDSAGCCGKCLGLEGRGQRRDPEMEAKDG